MKYFIAILCSSFTLFSWGQKQPVALGIGFAVANNPHEFVDYSTPQNIYSNKELSVELKGVKVHPFFFKPDYGLYHFICVEKTKSYYKVLVNDSSFAFLPNDSNYQFMTWDSLLVGAIVERITQNNPIKANADHASSSISYTCNHERLEVKRVLKKEGDYWIEVAFSKNCEDVNSSNNKLSFGWIKWREGNKLLVKIMLLC